jgi:hypothetical protein
MPLICGCGNGSPSVTSVLVTVKAGAGGNRAKGSHAVAAGFALGVAVNADVGLATTGSVLAPAAKARERTMTPRRFMPMATSFSRVTAIKVWHSCPQHTAHGRGVKRPHPSHMTGSGRQRAKELTELLPHIARGLNVNWDEAIRYTGLNAES